MKSSAIKISHEKLHDALRLSQDVHIDDIFMNDGDRFTRSLHIILSGDHPYLTSHAENSEVATLPLYAMQDIQPTVGYGLAGMAQGFYSGIRRYL
jgi:hypothetical protein